MSLVLLGAFLLILPGGPMFVSEMNERPCRAAHYNAVQKSQVPRPLARQSVLILAKRFPDRSRRVLAQAAGLRAIDRALEWRRAPALPDTGRARDRAHGSLSPPLRC